MMKTLGIAGAGARCLLTLALSTWGGLFAAPAASAQTRAAVGAGALADWRSKVDAEVLSRAAAGPTEFFVYLTRQADLGGAAALPTKEEKGRFVYARLTSVARESQGPLTSALRLLGVKHQTYWVTNAVWVRGDLAVVEALALRADVARLLPVGTGRLSLPPQASALSTADASASPAEAFGVDPAPEQNLLQVNAHEAWALGYEGQGVVVAGADSGVAWTHAALKGKYRGWDGSRADHNYNWHDAIKNPNTGCPGNSPEPCDDDVLLGGGHGTHTIGTVVGDDGGANRIGMAPRAEWIACRNMNNGVGVVPFYLDCMQWFIAPTDAAGRNPDPAKAPHVINNSWGCVEGCAQPLLQDPLRASRAAGILYVVSAGNDGSTCNTLQFPLARYPEAFTVGATDHRTDLVADFSSRGSVLADPTSPLGLRKPDISAPGVSIRSALRDGGYGSLSGTSMAGPHVAGLGALVISANPRLAGQVERVEEIIEQTAVRRTSLEGCGGDQSATVPNNTYGWGRIDALAAVREALPPTASDDAAVTSPQTPVRVHVLANDTDPDGDPLAVTSLTAPAHGAVSDNGDGTVTYTPAAGFAGVDAFDYTVCAPEGCQYASDTATVRVELREAGLTNYALAALGSAASASSTSDQRGYTAAAATDGERTGRGWESGAGWNDATRDLWPDTLTVSFGGAKLISQLRVYTLQNDYASPAVPDATTDASLYGIRDFEVQALDPSTGQWATVPGGLVSGNTKALRVVTLPQPVPASAVRVVVHAGRQNFSRVVELEAYGAPGQ